MKFLEHNSFCVWGNLQGMFFGRWSSVVSCCIVNVNSGSRLACPALMWLPAFPRHQACSVQLRAREGVSLSLLTGCGHKLHSVVLHLICWPLARSRSHPSFWNESLARDISLVSGAIDGSLVGHLLRIMRRTLPFDKKQYRSSLKCCSTVCLLNCL